MTGKYFLLLDVNKIFGWFEIFETMLAARNHVGLLSEDTHPVTGEMWGNFPQTYSMVGIINAAVRLSAPWDSQI